MCPRLQFRQGCALETAGLRSLARGESSESSATSESEGVAAHASFDVPELVRLVAAEARSGDAVGDEQRRRRWTRRPRCVAVLLRAARYFAGTRSAKRLPAFRPPT
jgi:hypothetical protein